MVIASRVCSMIDKAPSTSRHITNKSALAAAFHLEHESLPSHPHIVSSETSYVVGDDGDGDGNVIVIDDGDDDGDGD